MACVRTWNCGTGRASKMLSAARYSSFSLISFRHASKCACPACPLAYDETLHVMSTTHVGEMGQRQVVAAQVHVNGVLAETVVQEAQFCQEWEILFGVFLRNLLCNHHQ